MVQKQKTEKKKREREKEREKERKYVIIMAKLRMAHASTHGARKPPGPKNIGIKSQVLCISESLDFFRSIILNSPSPGPGTCKRY